MEFRYKNISKVSKAELLKKSECLSKYSKYLTKVSKSGDYKENESSINLPFDEELKIEVEKLKKDKCTDDLKYIVVIGIGGSNLGTKAVYDAMLGSYDKYTHSRFPKILFVDTNNSQEMYKLISFLEKKVRKQSEILVNVISKSGTTTETIANAEVIIRTLRRLFGDHALSRMVVITDDKSPIAKVAQEKEISILSIPQKVGGRFSVLSAVGLFPLLCADIDIKELQKGAEVMVNKCIESNIEDNPAMLSASILFYHYQNNKTIHDTFIFAPQLESLGKWYRQLLGESVGKEKDKKGEVINVGITPIVSIGSTDLHSVGQLYLGGPKDKVTTFISINNVEYNIEISDERIFENIISDINNKKFSEISDAILDGVKIAYKNHDIPFMNVEFKNISEFSIGEFLQFKMMEIMYLGELMNVNVFDQPNVESYKTETKSILNKK